MTVGELYNKLKDIENLEWQYTQVQINKGTYKDVDGRLKLLLEEMEAIKDEEIK